MSRPSTAATPASSPDEELLVGVRHSLFKPRYCITCRALPRISRYGGGPGVRGSGMGVNPSPLLVMGPRHMEDLKVSALITGITTGERTCENHYQ